MKKKIRCEKELIYERAIGLALKQDEARSKVDQICHKFKTSGDNAQAAGGGGIASSSASMVT